MWRSGFQFEIERLFSGIEGGGGGALAVIRLIAKMVLITVLDVTPSKKEGWCNFQNMPKNT